MFWLLFHPLIVYLVASNVHGKVDFDKRDLSSDLDNAQVSASINDAFAKAGFDAAEIEKIRSGYHVVVDEFDDNEDESRQLLSVALSKNLDAPDVEKIDGALYVLGDKFDKLIPRDVDTTTGSGSGSDDGVKTGHVIIIDSTDSDDDLVARDLDLAEIVATLVGDVQSGKGPIPHALKKIPHDHAGGHKDHGNHPEKREEATDHAGPQPVDDMKESATPVQEELVRPTPTDSLRSFFDKFKDMGLLDDANVQPHRVVSPADIFAQIAKLNATTIQSLPENESAKLGFLAKLKAMGLLKKPRGKKVMTFEEFWQFLQDHTPKVNPVHHPEPPVNSDAPTEVHEVVPVPEPSKESIPEAQGSHSKRSVEVSGCDCKATIDAVIEPKPEGGMTYEWFKKWKHKKVEPVCVHLCVDNAIGRFTEKVREFQSRERQERQEMRDSFDWHYDFPKAKEHVPENSKREEPTDLPESAVAKIPVVKNKPLKPAHDATYRDWYKKTQKSGELCTCHLQSPSLWGWVMAITQKSQRCKSFCSQSVKPFLEKDKETPAVPHEPALTSPGIEEPVEEHSPPSSEDAPNVAPVPVSEGPKVDTRPHREPLVKNQ
ncbi:hypothetical protein Q7P35_007277 [Cladosporium inversicolor]